MSESATNGGRISAAVSGKFAFHASRACAAWPRSTSAIRTEEEEMREHNDARGIRSTVRRACKVHGFIFILPNPDLVSRGMQSASPARAPIQLEKFKADIMSDFLAEF